jgi:hypothetical protein
LLPLCSLTAILGQIAAIFGRRFAPGVRYRRGSGLIHEMPKCAVTCVMALRRQAEAICRLASASNRSPYVRKSADPPRDAFVCARMALPSYLLTPRSPGGPAALVSHRPRGHAPWPKRCAPLYLAFSFFVRPSLAIPPIDGPPGASLTLSPHPDIAHDIIPPSLSHPRDSCRTPHTLKMGMKSPLLGIEVEMRPGITTICSI